MLCRVTKHKETWHSGRAFRCSETGTYFDPGFPLLLYWGNSSQVSTWASNEKEARFNNVTESRIWLPPSENFQQKTVLRGPWKSLTVNLSGTVFVSCNEKPASKRLSACKKNLKRLGRFSEQESEKYHIITVNECFPTNYIYTRKDEMLCRVTKHKETWHSGKAFGCSETGTCFDPGFPLLLYWANSSQVSTWTSNEKDARFNNVTESRIWLPPSENFEQKSGAAWTLKVTDCKAEWYSIHLR